MRRRNKSRLRLATFSEAEADIQAYADGTLTPDRAAFLQDYLGKDPAEARRVAFYGRLNAQIGFPDRNGGGSGSWNSAHGTRGCAQADLPKTHGQGLFYCFAAN